MSKRNTAPVLAGGPTDPIIAGGYGSLDYRISVKDFWWAQKLIREGGGPAGSPANTPGADTWPFDGVIARE
jgi:hypothetical protein